MTRLPLLALVLLVEAAVLIKATSPLMGAP